jgi:hypothetical protein
VVSHLLGPSYAGASRLLAVRQGTPGWGARVYVGWESGEAIL